MSVFQAQSNIIQQIIPAMNLGYGKKEAKYSGTNRIFVTLMTKCDKYAVSTIILIKFHKKKQ